MEGPVLGLSEPEEARQRRERVEGRRKTEEGGQSVLHMRRQKGGQQEAREPQASLSPVSIVLDRCLRLSLPYENTVPTLSLPLYRPTFVGRIIGSLPTP